MQKRILNREAVVGADHQEKLAEIEEQKTAASAKLKALQERWDKERELVVKIRELREKLEAGHAANGTERRQPPQPLLRSSRSCRLLKASWLRCKARLA